MAILPLWEIIEEAYERIQIDPRAGYDYRSARRSLDLLHQRWDNEGLHFWTINTQSYAVTQGVSEITLNVLAHDLLDAVVKETGTNFDTALDRISLTDWLGISFKTQQGRPTRYAVRRMPTSVKLLLWQVPDKAYTVTCNQIHLTAPASAYDGSPTIPERFQPAMIAGLAYYLAQKRNPKRIGEMKALYDEEMYLATGEDRDRSSFFVTPDVGR